MKAMALVPAAVAAILALNISGASSQAACTKEYQACMDTCGARPNKQAQDTCFQGCEGKNNFCAEKVYGKRPVAAPAVAAEPNGAAANANAMAKDKPQDAAPAADTPKEQATEELTQEQPAPAAKEQHGKKRHSKR
jgi:hypothetical protein